MKKITRPEKIVTAKKILSKMRTYQDDLISDSALRFWSVDDLDYLIENYKQILPPEPDCLPLKPKTVLRKKNENQ